MFESTITINIHKEAGARKDAIRVSSVADIPAFLTETITICGDSVQLVNVEMGISHCPLGSVIGYEKSESSSTGWNAWHIANAATNLIEQDGVFYKKATVFKAMKVGESLPEWLEGAPIRHNADGSWTITTPWGESTGFPGKSYWILYGTNEDGSIDANILTKSEKSYKDYIVCDDDGNDLGYLAELDPYVED